MSYVVIEWRQLSLRMPPHPQLLPCPMDSCPPSLTHTHTPGLLKPGVCKKMQKGDCYSADDKDYDCASHREIYPIDLFTVQLANPGSIS